MKVYILTDLEGVCGVVNFETQTSPSGRYYEEACELLTLEVNSAIEGALGAGAEEFLVLDGHGAGALKLKLLHPRAKALLGRPLPLDFCLSRGFDAMFIVGQHAMAGTERGCLHHTYSHISIVRMWLNGDEIGEIGINAGIAGYYGVPMALLSGDESACEEAKKYNPDCVTVAVKEGIAQRCAICLHPEVAREMIREGAREALEQLDRMKPFKPSPPYELVIEYLSIDGAESASSRPWVERLSPTKVRVTADDFIELLRRQR